MSQSECVTANWYEQGVSDGDSGKASSHYSEYTKDCSEFGIHVDNDAYKIGWEEGIAHYCTRDNGYIVGNNGRIYQHNCPIEFKDSFYSAYQLGRAIYTKQFKISLLRNKISKIGDELAKDDLTSDKRNSLAAERKRLKRDVELASIGLALSKVEAKQQGFPVLLY